MYNIGYRKDGTPVIVDETNVISIPQNDMISLTSTIEEDPNRVVRIPQRLLNVIGDLAPENEWPMYEAWNLLLKNGKDLADILGLERFKKVYLGQISLDEKSVTYILVKMGYTTEEIRMAQDRVKFDLRAIAEAFYNCTKSNNKNYNSPNYEIGYDELGRKAIFTKYGTFITHIPNNMSISEVLIRLKNGEIISYDARNQGLQNNPKIQVSNPVKPALRELWPLYSLWDNIDNDLNLNLDELMRIYNGEASIDKEWFYKILDYAGYFGEDIKAAQESAISNLGLLQKNMKTKEKTIN